MSAVRSVTRAFDVLKAVAARPLGVTEIASRTRLPKSTVARLLATLEAAGAVAQEPDARYGLGPAIRDSRRGPRASATCESWRDRSWRSWRRPSVRP